MKNQNDLIFSIVFGVLALIAVGVAFGTKPDVPAISPPPVIDVSDAKLPTDTDPVMGLALPSGGSAAGGGAGGFGGGRGFGGPPGGFGAPSGSHPRPPGLAGGGGRNR